MAERCPCTSGLPYRTCCGPFHRGEREAPTPEALMRSRFAAFARADAGYLWRTLHPEHEDRLAPEQEALVALREAARSHRYVRLRILDAAGDRVLFLAGVFQKGKDLSFVELSVFAHDGVGWRYRHGDAVPAQDAGDPAGLTLSTFRPASRPR